MLTLRAAVLSLVVMLTGCVGYSYQPVGYGYPAYPAVYGGYSPGYVAPVVVAPSYGYRPGPYYRPAPYYRPVPPYRPDHGHRHEYRERHRG